MRLACFPAIVLSVCLIAGSSPRLEAAEEAKPIGPAEAAKKVGKEVVLEMTVKSTSLGGGICFLNSEKDFNDAKNFTLIIPAAAMAKFKEAKIGDPAAHFIGKLVRASGKVIKYHDRPKIKLTGPADLTIVRGKKAEKK